MCAEPITVLSSSTAVKNSTSLLTLWVEMACENEAAASTFISAACATIRPKSAISTASIAADVLPIKSAISFACFF
jgi:hypothetical protein